MVTGGGSKAPSGSVFTASKFRGRMVARDSRDCAPNLGEKGKIGISWEATFLKVTEPLCSTKGEKLW